MILKIFLLTSSILSSFSVFAVNAKIEKDTCKPCVRYIRRAAFDISGSSIKVLVADVNIKTKKLNKLFNAKIDVDFKKDLSKQSEKKEFSAEIQAVALAALQQLQDACSQYQPEQSTAIAAEAFRFIGNGETMLNDLSHACQLPIHITSQAEKGELEFWSAIANSNADPETTVVVDMCSMNAHITSLNDNGEIITFGQKLGYGMIDEFISKNIRKLEKTASDINPVHPDEALQVVDYLEKRLKDMPEILKAKLASEDSSVIATFTPVAGEESWEKTSGWQFLQDEILCHTTQVGSPPILTSKALFVYTLIDKFNVEECTLIGSDVHEGSAPGVLVTESYWSLLND